MAKTKIESIEDLQIKIYMMRIEIDETHDRIKKLVNRMERSELNNKDLSILQNQITEINKKLNINKKTVLKF
ncbi:MAG: hypothetical protein H8E55_24405 [Pelagibacterales bacterium]|nr:hypothetical protein [Pelagibacterales bacterium]